MFVHVGFDPPNVRIALTPAAVECGVEMTFPVSEATSGGLLLCGANVIGTIMVLVLTLVPGVNAFLGIACGSFIVMPLLLWFKPVLMRLNEESKVMQVTDESKLLPDDAIINK